MKIKMLIIFFPLFILAQSENSLSDSVYKFSNSDNIIEFQKQIIKDKITGRIVPAADPHKLADSIKAALLEKDITRKYAKAGLELVRKRHTVDCMLNRLDSIYQSFLKPKIRKPN